MLSQVSRAKSRISIPSTFLGITSIMILGLVLTAGTTFASTGSSMQDSDTASEKTGGRKMPSVDDQLQKLTQTLNLTDDQQAKIKPILENQRAQMEAIRSDSGSRRDHFTKMREVHNQTVSQVKENLNDDQKKKYDEIQDQMKEEGRKRMRQR